MIQSQFAEKVSQWISKVRTKRVRIIRKRLRSGAYRVSNEKIARALFLSIQNQ